MVISMLDEIAVGAGFGRMTQFFATSSMVRFLPDG